MINRPALCSLSFCDSLLALMDCREVTLLPVILDEGLLQPASEVDLLQSWCARLATSLDGNDRRRIDSMLRRFGPMVEQMRNTLVPTPLFET